MNWTQDATDTLRALWAEGHATDTLRALWAEGHATSEIGRRIGTTKNAIIGRAHRLGLSSRPSPIIQNGVRRAVRPPRASVVTLPPLPSADPAFVAPVRPPVFNFHSSVTRMKFSAPARPAVTPRPPDPHGRVLPCCWPEGDPGTKGFRFCEVPSRPDAPYCEPHCKIAYVQMRPRVLDAAQ